MSKIYTKIKIAGIRSKTILGLVLLLSLMFSCLNSSNETNWRVGEQLSGKYHFLDDNGSKVYLPLDFERYSLSKYQRLLDSLGKKKEYKFETEHLNILSKMEGALYIFFDKKTGSTCTINTIPYYPFTKDNATEILGLIQANQEKVAKKVETTFTKITAKYGGNSKEQLFKTIYKVTSKKNKIDVFSSAYIISSNDKTVFIQLTTGFKTEFDPFIDKLML